MGRNAVASRRAGGNVERQALTRAFEGPAHRDRMKCAGKGFQAGGNSMRKVTEASNVQGASATALWVPRPLEQGAEAGTALP